MTSNKQINANWSVRFFKNKSVNIDKPALFTIYLTHVNYCVMLNTFILRNIAIYNFMIEDIRNLYYF